jgi:hypothetical protein
MFAPGAAVTCCILPPGNVIAISGSPEHVHITIAIHIGGMHSNGTNKVGIYDLSCRKRDICGRCIDSEKGGREETRQQKVG